MTPLWPRLGITARAQMPGRAAMWLAANSGSFGRCLKRSAQKDRAPKPSASPIIKAVPNYRGDLNLAVSVFVDHGSATPESLDVWDLRSLWWPNCIFRLTSCRRRLIESRVMLFLLSPPSSYLGNYETRQRTIVLIRCQPFRS